MGFDFDRETRRRLGVVGRLDNLRRRAEYRRFRGEGLDFQGEASNRLRA
jgi:hypothetical protein